METLVVKPLSDFFLQRPELARIVLSQARPSEAAIRDTEMFLSSIAPVFNAAAAKLKAMRPSKPPRSDDELWRELDRLRIEQATPIRPSKPPAPTSPGPEINGVPDHVRAAFAGAPYLTLPKLAKAMRMDRKTLNGHRESQTLPVHIKGTGKERQHYVVTLGDVEEFYRRTGEASCQSSRSRTRPSINSTSRSKVIDFTGRQSAKMNVKPRKSKRRSGLKLSVSSPIPLRPAESQ
jgi:hypothetical protein